MRQSWSPKRFVKARWRLLISAVLGLAVISFLPADLLHVTRLLIGWDAGIALYLILVLLMILGTDAARVRRDAAIQDEGHYAIPILTVIKHDSIFSGYPANFPVALERYHAIVQGGDYAALAKSLGWWSERVERPDQLRDVFQRALAATRDGQPALVDVITKETTKLSTYGSH